jgi:hypothetical protein
MFSEIGLDAPSVGKGSATHRYRWASQANAQSIGSGADGEADADD